jgi:hypothetical protein
MIRINHLLTRSRTVECFCGERRDEEDDKEEVTRTRDDNEEMA